MFKYAKENSILVNHEHGESLAEHGGSLAKQVKPKDQKLNLYLK